MISKSVEETKKIAKDFLEELSKLKTTGKAVVVGLFGDLGSGKTTFTQVLGKYLGVEDVMTSPTFVIEKKYYLDGKFGFNHMIHIDAYRLEGREEILNLNFNEDLKNPTNLILIEWPGNVDGALPADLIRVDFKFLNDTEREIDFVLK